VKLRYSPLLSVRPNPQTTREDQLILSDAWSGKRFLVQREALGDVLLFLHGKKLGEDSRINNVQEKLESAGILGSELTTEEKAHIRHWWNRGWHPSLEYYLWSRRVFYADIEDSHGEIRYNAIKRYLADGSPPPRIAPRGESLPLEPVDLPSAALLGSLLVKRRTVRRYLLGEVPQSRLSGTLWWGLHRIRELRKVPRQDPTDYLLSHGVAFDFYVIVYAVRGVSPGIYFYDLKNHSLVQVRRGDVRKSMYNIIFKTPAILSANWTILIVADVLQYQWLYRHERALRNLYIEAGRVGQRLILTALAYGQGSLTTPAFRDEQLSKLLDLEPVRQVPIYSITAGSLHREQQEPPETGREYERDS